MMSCWPSLRVLADEMGEKPNTVSKWKNRGRIPPEKMLKFLAVAKRRGVNVTADDLLRAAAE